MSRSLRRFYVDQDLAREGIPLKLTSRETFHLHRVLRLNAGDSCQIFNREGGEAEAQIEKISETLGAELRLTKVFPLRPRPFFLKVAQALPQKRKMDQMVDWAQELGVQELWVLESERSVVKMRGEGRERARKRWERIVIEAAKQSKNSFLMKIEGPVSFEEALKGLTVGAGEPAFLFHPDPKAFSFSSVVEEISKTPRPRSVSLCLGPEGGFTEKEVGLAEARGIRKVFLGESILRVETAFLGVIGALRFLIQNRQPAGDPSA